MSQGSFSPEGVSPLRAEIRLRTVSKRQAEGIGLMAAKPVALLHLAPLAGGGVKKMPGGHLYPRAARSA
jgi:hypothetical protein